MRYPLLQCLLVVSFMLVSCGKHQPAELPTFISISDIEYVVEPSQGTNRHLITELWIYADSQFIGAYPVHAQFPIIAPGTFHLDVFPGIRENGQALSPTIYQMMSPDQVVVPSQPGGIIEIHPTFSYAEEVVVALNEDFESSNIFSQDLDGDTATAFVRISEGAIDGRSAMATLNSNHQELEVASKFGYGTLPDNGLPTYLEMEYSSDVPLAVGIRVAGSANSVYKLVLFANPTNSQKIYINFSNEIQILGKGAYEILFRCNFDPDLPKVSQEVTIDNIKLLHFRP